MPVPSWLQLRNVGRDVLFSTVCAPRISLPIPNEWEILTFDYAFLCGASISITYVPLHAPSRWCQVSVQFPRHVGDSKWRNFDCSINFQNSQIYICLKYVFCTRAKPSPARATSSESGSVWVSHQNRSGTPTHFSPQVYKKVRMSSDPLSKTPIQLDKCRLRQPPLLKTTLCTMSMLLVILKNRLRYQNSRYSSFYWYSLRNLSQVWSSIRSLIDSSERLV